MQEFSDRPIHLLLGVQGDWREPSTACEQDGRAKKMKENSLITPVIL